MNEQSPFKWRHFEANMVLLCVHRYLLSYHDLEEGQVAFIAGLFGVAA